MYFKITQWVLPKTRGLFSKFSKITFVPIFWSWGRLEGNQSGRVFAHAIRVHITTKHMYIQIQIITDRHLVLTTFAGSGGLKTDITLKNSMSGFSNHYTFYRYTVYVRK